METFGSLEKREKADFILEQMRLSLLKKDYSRAQLASRKLGTKIFADKANSDLKIRFYTLMIQYAIHEGQYLNVCKYYRHIYDTPIVKEDKEKLATTLRDVVVFVVLAPFDNEQSDLIHRVKEDPNLNEISILRYSN